MDFSDKYLRGMRVSATFNKVLTPKQRRGAVAEANTKARTGLRPEGKKRKQLLRKGYELVPAGTLAHWRRFADDRDVRPLRKLNVAAACPIGQVSIVKGIGVVGRGSPSVG